MTQWIAIPIVLSLIDSWEENSSRQQQRQQQPQASQFTLHLRRRPLRPQPPLNHLQHLQLTIGVESHALITIISNQPTLQGIRSLANNLEFIIPHRKYILTHLDQALEVC